MAVGVGSSFSCLSTALSSPSRTRNRIQFSLPRQRYIYPQQETLFIRYAKDRSCKFIHTVLSSKGRSHNLNTFLFAVSEDRSQQQGRLESVSSEEENLRLNDDDDFYSGNLDSEGISTVSSSIPDHNEPGGKSGFVSFYNRPYKIVQQEGIVGSLKKSPNNLLWFVGPAVLVASFVFPSLYLRRLLSAVFEDSLLTDFLILFFTEALFYCGVAVFVLLIDRLKRPAVSESPTPQLEQRISSVATLVLSLIIPMVTMGLVWPWTGPAASATLAPYLVGIIVQFAFEQYARYRKSPSWPVIPIIFQVYRLHQLNRAAQLVTALSFTVKGAEMTVHNMAINNSLGTLLNVLQCLGVICIWSLSNFLMRFFPSTSVSAQ